MISTVLNQQQLNQYSSCIGNTTFLAYGRGTLMQSCPAHQKLLVHLCSPAPRHQRVPAARQLSQELLLQVHHSRSEWTAYVRYRMSPAANTANQRVSVDADHRVQTCCSRSRHGSSGARHRMPPLHMAAASGIIPQRRTQADYAVVQFNAVHGGCQMTEQVLCTDTAVATHAQLQGH